MKFGWFLLATVMAFAVFLAVPAISEDGDATITITPLTKSVVFTGETVLTENTRFEDGSNIVIMALSDIDISRYTLDFGKDSTVAVAGSADIRCSTGKIVFGEGSTLIMIGASVPKFTHDTTITFNGTLSLTSPIASKNGVVCTFIPSGSNHWFNISWEGHRIAIEDPAISYSAVNGGFSLNLGFNRLSSTTWNSRDGIPESTKVTTLYSNNSTDSIVLTITEGGMSLDSLGVTKITSNTEYEESDIRDYMEITEIGPTTISKDSEGYLVIDSAAEQFLTESFDGEKLLRSTKFINITYRSITDPAAPLLMMLDTGTTQEVNDWLKSLRITSTDGYIVDTKLEEERHIYNISLNVYGSNTKGGNTSDPYLVLTYHEDDETKTLTISGVEMQSFGLSTGFKLDIQAYVKSITFVTTSPDGQGASVLIDNSTISADNLDISELYTIYAKTGQIKLQDLLDNSDGFGFDSEHVTINRKDSAGEHRMSAETVSINAQKDLRGYNTLSIRFALMEGYGPYEEHMWNYAVQQSEIYMESSGPLSECIDAFFEKIDFSSDAYAQVRLSSSGFSVGYTEEDDVVNITMSKISDKSPSYATAFISINHSTYEDKTDFSGTLSATGYNVAISRHKTYEDPAGELNFLLNIKNLLGSFNLSYGQQIGFGLDLKALWSLDYSYYGIEFQVDGGETELSTSRGTIYVSGYNPKKEGVINMFEDMMDEDYIVDTRLAFNSDDITVYRNNRSEVYLQYDNLEVEAKDITIQMEQEVNMHIHLVEAGIYYLETDGTEFKKYFDVLDINRDLKENDEPEPSIVEKYYTEFMIGLAAIGLILLIALIYHRVKNPVHFKYIEGEHEDEEE